ncbi:RluA family pseudouridine synthase [Ramlibacter tataouinensis]|nr:RluA family pseudouridine synthase [Ramlibacter tataouinensis]WBY04072.1 RluA family pseudouridine synthase [Ramlibacter tataouinensis]
MRTFAVEPAQHGLRLDQALAERVPEFSRSYLQQLVNGGAVALNGRRAARPAHRVKAGDQLAIELRPTPQSLAFRPEPMPIAVVHEDEHLLVIDKPPGLVVHPAPGNWSGTLLNGLLARDPQAGRLPRAGIVHRLDKDTSGLMVVARTRATMDALVRLIAAREVARQYLAIGLGRWQGAATQVVEAPIGRDPRNRLRMAVVDPARDAGKSAMTTFELLDNGAAACLVRASLHTGRTHQIRVHMAHLGHRLLGDELYGAPTPPPDGEGSLARQALHAFRLAFVHPATGQPLAFVSPLPADFRHALSAWGLRYNPPPALAPAATPAGPA